MSHSAIPPFDPATINPAVPATQPLTPTTPETAMPVNPVITEAKQLLQPAARLWLYGVCVAAIPLLVAFGKITGDQASLWTDFAASVLGVSGLTVAIANVKR
jgi:hypothetical protein